MKARMSIWKEQADSVNCAQRKRPKRVKSASNGNALLDKLRRAHDVPSSSEVKHTNHQSQADSARGRPEFTLETPIPSLPHQGKLVDATLHVHRRAGHMALKGVEAGLLS